MKFRSAAFSMLATALYLAPVGAMAGGHHHHHHGSGDAGLIFGLAALGIAVAAIASTPTYYEPPPQPVYYAPQPAYYSQAPAYYPAPRYYRQRPAYYSSGYYYR